MSRIRNLALVGAGSIAALTIAAAPALAATTTIHSGSADGPAYAGGVVATNLGAVSVTTSIGGGSCTESTMEGDIQSDGTGLTVNAVAFNNCTSGSNAVTVAAANVPWSGGSVEYGPVAGGEDGKITLANFTVSAVVFGITCTYSGTISGPGYNPDNPNRPDTTVAQAQAKIDNAVVKKAGGSWLCPGTATVNAAYQLVGAGGEQLWATS